VPTPPDLSEAKSAKAFLEISFLSFQSLVGENERFLLDFEKIRLEF
jgi:hypothetical protein